MQETGIEWTHFSSNLLKYRDLESNKIVWACAKVSDGCKHCYSETLAHRYQKGGPFTLQQVRKVRPFFDEDEARKMLRSKKLSGKRVFIDDMTDLFGEWVPDEIIDKHFAVFALRPDVAFQVLTKRPERMAKYGMYRNDDPFDIRIANSAFALKGWQVHDHDAILADLPGDVTWPLANLWVGTSCENRETLNRVHHLRRCRAAVRFLSLEPLLEDLGTLELDGIHWVIVGGESGPKARPCDVRWVRSIIEQCKAAGVPAFCKQLGSRPVVWECGAGDEFTPDAPGYGPLGYQGRPLRDHKGGDPSEWPEDLRVREMPDATVPA